MSGHAEEVLTGERFEFGKNWSRFLSLLNEERICRAEDSLLTGLRFQNLTGQTFLDVGSGSGLFSLAARRLGARVHSFDYDPESVACALELKRRYFRDDGNWVIEQGSVLDREYLKRLDQFDIVYSWGVLHHTGTMWDAMDNVGKLVAPGGSLFISIYNDQGGASRRWRIVKRLYNRTPLGLRFLILIPAFFYLHTGQILRDFVRLKPFAALRSYPERRGMSALHDLVDWVGGYPFEVARPEEVFDFYWRRRFVLTRLKTCRGDLGCNEFVFTNPNPA